MSTTTVSKIPPPSSSSHSSNTSSSFPINVSTFFNSSSHDLILQTPSLQFYVETLYLSASSQVFKNILSLPHSSSSSSKDILKIDEDGSLFEDFLRFIHRTSSPPPSGLAFDRLLEIRKICTKYDVDVGATRLCEEMFKHVKEKPLEVWAIAASHGQEGLAKSCYAYFPTSVHDSALGKSRNTSPSDVPKELMEDVPATALWHLLRSYDRVVGSGLSWHEAGKAT